MESNLGKVSLVRDINLGSDYGFNSSDIDNLEVFRNKVYFSANNGLNGRELWISDGTTGGTQLVKNINPGRNYQGTPRSSNPYNFTEAGNKIYFSANDRVNGSELWVTNGTENGTQLVADIAAGDFNGSYPRDFTEFNNQLFFTADDEVNGRELWVTNGTENGTQLVADINPGSYEGYYGNSPYSSTPRDLTVVNNQLFFAANDGVNGRELWISDGTENGTQLVKDINPGSYESYYGGTYPNSSTPRYLTVANNQLFFSANDGVNGRELWVSDGTENGTQLVKDINPGSDSSLYSYSEGYFTEFNNQLFFTADDGVNGRELWVSNGTENGTQLVKDINPGSYEGDYGNYPYSSSPSDLTVVNNQLFFAANDGVNGRELWVSDGTENGTQLVKDINPGSDSSLYSYSGGDFTEFNDKLYFAANDGVNGRELWVSDGTSEGTQLVADINPGSDGSYVGDLAVVGQELFFTANNGATGRELFKLSFDNSTTITGSNSANNIAGSNSANKIEGLNGNDTLSGLGGNDALSGGNGNDSLDGGTGNDSLLGGNDSDTLLGGNGNDVLNGGAGSNVLTGGAGNDVFAIRNGSGSESITDFRVGKDLIGLTGGLEFDDLTFSGNTIRSGSDLLATVTGVETLGLTEANLTTI